MDTLLHWMNEPGPIRWVVDIVLLPAIAVVLTYGLRSLYLRFALKDHQSEAAQQVRRQTSRMLAFLVTLAAVTIIWRLRLQSLAGRADLTLEEREILVNWLGGAVNAVIATAFVVFLLVILGRVHRWAVRRLDAWKETRKGLQFQGKTLITPSRVRQFVMLGVKVARFVLTLGLLYVYVPLVLSFIPATRPLAGQVMPVVIGPLRDLALAVLRYLPRLVSLFVIVIVMRFFIRLVLFLMDAVGKEEINIPGFDSEWAEQTGKLLRIVLILGTVMIIYPFLPGAGSDVFRGFSLFVGAVFTLGASSSVSNMISGIILTYTRAFRVGERIRVGGTTGDVVTRGLFVTRLRTVYNEVVTVPNNVALGDRVVNYSAATTEGGLVLGVTAGIGYDVDWRQVHELMKAAARGTESILEDPEPIVLQTELADCAVAYELRAWTHDANRISRTRSALRRNVLDAFNQAGVEIMTPTVNAVRNSVEPAIPEAYVDKPTPAVLRFLGPQGSTA
jgi:small-conductance mechanosensitive channel